MYLYWHKNKGIRNFGDDLNPYILERLTGNKINYLPIADPKIIRILKLVKRIIFNQISYKDSLSVIKSLQSRKYYVAVGSVIEKVKGKNCCVWGAGLIKRSGNIKKCNFFAVRGEITRNRIKELGHNVPAAIGDPALLLPIVYHSDSKKKYDLGIIPHYVQMADISRVLNVTKDNVIIIDLLNNLETIIDQINSCKKTISSSLHGLIVSHAYGIPSLWCNLGDTPLAGDDVKFEDYFSSVNITFYEKFKFDLNDNLINQTNDLFINFGKLSLINKNINEIQKNLILHSPFDILEKYKNDLAL